MRRTRVMTGAAMTLSGAIIVSVMIFVGIVPPSDPVTAAAGTPGTPTVTTQLDPESTVMSVDSWRR